MLGHAGRADFDASLSNSPWMWATRGKTGESAVVAFFAMEVSNPGRLL
jgi:hypothetical protein